jgi:putative transposase
MRHYRRAAHTVYEIHYHFVFTTKYRKPVLRGEVAERVRDLTREICRTHDIDIVRGHVRPDHVHLLLSVPPHVSASRVMQSIKGNLNIRMGSRRFTRLTNAFSKRAENHAHAVALHFWHYNFARKHLTLKTTPAVAAGIASKPITMLDLVRMIENEERKLGGRLTDYLPACQP